MGKQHVLIDRIGEKITTKEGDIITIIGYRNSKDCDIQFDYGLIKKNIPYNRIVFYNIKSPFRKSVCNIGYVGVGDYGKKSHSKIYQNWENLLKRCYSDKFRITHPTYIGCSVHPDWHNYQIYAKWYTENYIDGFELDKDILVKGNKIYSPDTCCFVPKEINLLFIKCDRRRGDLPIGVSYHKQHKKFISQCTISGHLTFLGYFETDDEAFQKYKEVKESEIKRLANKHKTVLSNNCYQSMLNYKVLKND